MANNNPVLQRHTAKMTFLCIVISLKIVLQRQKMVSFIFELLCNWINMRLSKNLFLHGKFVIFPIEYDQFLFQ